MEITLKELNENLTDEKIIELVVGLGSDSYIEKPDCIIFKTICHNENSDDASFKLYYYKNTKLFHCYTDCGESFNIFTLFQKRYELLNQPYNFYKDIVQVIANKAQVFKANNFYTKYESDYENYVKDIPQININSLNPNLLNKYVFYPTPEWISEGITIETMKKFNILYSIGENKIIIPHYDLEGNLIGIRGRALNPEDLLIGKYMPVQIEGKIYSHPLGYNLYGLNIVKDNIKKYKIAIVAEGEKSCLLSQSFYGEKNVCVASCGSSFHKFQLDLLINCGAERVLLAYDKEGINSQEKEKYFNKLYKICKKYKNYCRMGFIYDYNNLLELKDSPFDKGKIINQTLIKKSVWL